MMIALELNGSITVAIIYPIGIIIKGVTILPLVDPTEPNRSPKKWDVTRLKAPLCTLGGVPLPAQGSRLRQLLNPSVVEEDMDRILFIDAHDLPGQSKNCVR